MPTALVFTATQPATHSLIVLHGLGASGDDFADVVTLLQLRASTRVILPNAPTRPTTFSGGLSIPAWYDLYDRSFPRQREDLEGMAESALWIQDLMATEQKLGVPAENIMLMGFSQGGALALHVGLRQMCAGIIALSTYLTDADNTPPAPDQRPIVFMHGRSDAVVPMSAGESALQVLRAKQYNTQWHEYEMAHQLCEEQIHDLGKFLHAQGF